jgi:hypothetical protein
MSAERRGAGLKRSIGEDESTIQQTETEQAAKAIPPAL